jgi:hypothetical protein
MHDFDGGGTVLMGKYMVLMRNTWFDREMHGFHEKYMEMHGLDGNCMVVMGNTWFW